jgi:molecular chaperone DnaJ
MRMPGSGTGTGGGYNIDFGDLFGNAGGAGGRLGDLLGGVFGNRGGTTTSRTRPRRGADVETETTLSFSDAINGTTVPLRLTGEGPCPVCKGTGAKAGTVPRVCPTCEGTGQGSRNLGSFAFSEPCRTCRGRGLVVDDPCQTCSGSGRAMSTRTIQARIPAGVEDGGRIKLAGKGARGENGGPAGDLYVRVHVKPHPHGVFGRSGANLTINVPVTFAEAALGAEIKVPSLGGMPVSLRIPAGTPSGRTFRVRGKGVRRKDGTAGDMLVTVAVQVPQQLTDKARDALEQFRDATAGADMRADLLRDANA